MNKFKLSTLIVSSLILVACSGGGGGNDNPRQKQPTSTTASSENTQNNTAQTSQPQTQATQTTAPQTNTEVSLGENEVVIDRNNYLKGVIKGVSIKNGDSEIAKLAGYNRKYSFNGALVNTEVSSDGMVNLVIDNTVGRIGGLYGKGLAVVLKNALYNPDSTVFYFGEETPITNIPTQGTTTYKGNASRFDKGLLVIDGVKNVGTATLIADFGAKTVQGELEMDSLRRNISLKEAPIIGNGFKGTAVAGENHWLSSTVNGEYEGKFYGPNMDEVAGKAIFADDKDLNTSFSAEKVSQ